MVEPVPAAPAEYVCAAADLAERGRAIVFNVMHFRQPARAFALRFEGRVAVSYTHLTLPTIYSV